MEPNDVPLAGAQPESADMSTHNYPDSDETANVITFSSPDTPAALDRLRASASELGSQHLRALERHLAQPRYHSGLARVAERAGSLVGYALVAHRRLRLGAALLEVGAIEALHAPAGDADLIEALLGECLGALMDQGLPIVTLGGVGAEFERFGLAAYRLRAEVELPARGAGADELREALAGDLDDLAALYQATYHGLPLIEDRAPPDWRAWLADRAALVLHDARGRVVGYAAPVDTTSPDTLLVGEAAAADAGAARLLCGALAARAGALGRDRAVLRLAPWHPVSQAAMQLGGSARLRARADAEPAALAGVVDLMGVLEGLVLEFERRLARSRYAGWNGNLRLELPEERFTLALEEGRASVIDGTRPADVRLRQIELPALAQLCLGYRAAADLRATGGLACDDAALGLIDILFPTVLAVE
jgi:hypothetical protein